MFNRIIQRNPDPNCGLYFFSQMPPLATKLLDTQSIALVSAWITNELAWTTNGPLFSWVTNALPNQLAIEHSAPNVRVSWPLPATNVVLESVNALNATPMTGWTTVPVSSYQTNANDIFVTLPLPAANSFYRLRRQ
jgi:hypothetical protein